MFSEPRRLVVLAALACVVPALSPLGGAAAPPAPGDWGPPVTISAAGGSDIRAAVAPSGEMAAVWGESGDVEWSIRPAGGEWSAAAPLAHHAGGAQMGYDGEGRLLVVYGQGVAGGPARILARTHDPVLGWDKAVVVAHRASGDLRTVDLAVNAHGEALLGWSSDTTGLVSRRTAGGAWTTDARWPRTLDIDVAIGDGGMGALMLYRWTGPYADEITLVYQVARQARGHDWGPSKVLQRIDQSPPWASPGSVAVDARGTTTAAWEQATTRDYQVVAIRARKGHRWLDPVELGKPVGPETPVLTMATPEGDVLVLWHAPWADDLSGALRPSVGPWSPFTHVCPGRGIVIGWDGALDPGGRAVVGVSRARSFDWGYGTRACLMNRHGRWSQPERLTSTTAYPTTAMSGGRAAMLWTGPQGLQARVHPAP